jgi:hypothetical protein
MRSLLARQPRHRVKVGSVWRQLRARWQQELIRASINSGTPAHTKIPKPTFLEGDNTRR